MKEDQHPRVLSATSLIGSEVRNPEGEHLGSIIELMIDMETGHVAYAVLAVGGFLGLGEKLFALPWIAFDDYFMLDVDKQWLKAAAGFDKHHWPETADRRFVHNRYGHIVAVRHDEPDAVGI